MTTTDGFMTLRSVVTGIVATSTHDEVRFARIVEAASPFLRAYVGVRLRRTPQIDADDVMQAVWVRAWRAWEIVDPRSLSGWLYRIAINVMVDEHRRLAMVRRLGQVPWTLVPNDDDERGRHPTDPMDVESEAIASVTYDEVRGLLGTNDRYLVEFADGASLAEIAQRNNTTVVAVKSAMWRSRARLRERVGAWA